jgi:uncharacterized protein YvpB
LPVVCFLLAGWGIVWLLGGEPLPVRAGSDETSPTVATGVVSSVSVSRPEAVPTVSDGLASDLQVMPGLGAPDGRVLPSSSTLEEPATDDDVAVTPSRDGGLPEEILLAPVPQGKQARNLSCELQSAADLAWYYGKPYTWEEIFARVGHDPGGNPQKGFVGLSLDDTPGYVYPRGYGVYAEPIAEALRELGLDAEVHYRRSAEWVKGQVARGRPVMIWATGGMTARPTEEWVAEDGTTVLGVRGEHTFLVVGYDMGGVWVVDPWVGGRRHYDWEVFLRSWDILDRMSVVIVQDKGVPAEP